jgi:hypothetical protein
MSDKLDDLEAVRTIVTTLGKFERADQERILRWTREKLGLGVEGDFHPHSASAVSGPTGAPSTPAAAPTKGSGRDIKTFMAEKRPASDNQFAAAVAYYYRFEAPEPERKLAITSADLQDAARLAGRSRFVRPGDTLHNALKAGLLDKGSERGTFTINTVGENLVAMALPENGGERATGRRRAGRKQAKKVVKRQTRTRRR